MNLRKRSSSNHGYLLPNRPMHEQAKRVMLREALKVALVVIMKNHVYVFDGEIRKQSKGGPIGLKLRESWRKYLYSGGTRN